MSPERGGARRWPGRALAALCALGLWQLAAMALDSRLLLASPAEVLARLGSLCREPDFWATAGHSAGRIALGFFAGLALGLALAALAGRFPALETLLWPYMATVKAVPVASFIVLCLLWLSARRLSAFVAFLIVLPVVYGNVLEGLRSADRAMLELGPVFRMSARRRLAYLYLPALKPFLFSACSTALGMAWKAGVAAEIIGTPAGSIGRRMYLAKNYLDTDDLLCWTLVVVLLSVAFEKLFLRLLAAGYHRLERG